MFDEKHMQSALAELNVELKPNISALVVGANPYRAIPGPIWLTN
jgi:hypothetical protein